jgi:hypothetical protein
MKDQRVEEKLNYLIKKTTYDKSCQYLDGTTAAHLYTETFPARELSLRSYRTIFDRLQEFVDNV